MGSSFPVDNVDLYCDEAIIHPYEHYRRLRDAGPAVWLSASNMWAIARYNDARETLRNHRTFSSAFGVAANEPSNLAARGTTLASDPPLHDELRGVVGLPLMPGAVATLKERISASADELVARLVAKGSFDAIADLARHLPVSIVSELVGLPEEGRQNMLRWAAATFNILGAMNDRARAALPSVNEMREYSRTTATPDKLKPNSWAARLYEAADRGLVSKEQCPMLMRDYLAPSLDTTILGTGNLIWLLGQHPEQWEILRNDLSLIPGAVNEALRLESPIRGFTRLLTSDHQLEDVTLPAGSRALILYASANRDERKWNDPERFDIRRKANDHLGFGHGVHACAGMHLARLEMTAVLTALVNRVRRFEIGEPVYAMNNVLRGLDKLPVTLH